MYVLIFVQAAHSVPAASALHLHCMLQAWTANPSLSAQLVKLSWLQQVDWGQPGTADHQWRSSVRRFVEPGQPVKPLSQTDAELAGIMPPSPQPRSSSMRSSSTHPIGRRSIGGRPSAGGDCMPASTMPCGDTSAPTRKRVSVAKHEFPFASSPAARSFPASGGVAGQFVS